MGVQRFLRIGITVADLDRQAGFFRDALGLDCGPLRVEDDPARLDLLGLPRGTVLRIAEIRVGQQVLELAQFDPPGRPYPAKPASNDPWFQHVALVYGDINAVWQRLQGHHAGTVTQGRPDLLPPNTGGVTAFKFRDPEGHPLELIAFPPGAGAPVWQDGTGSGIIGYDHSAVVVTDLAESLAFYRDILGFRIASRSLNQGPEQDRLDGLQGCLVDVVALAPSEAAVPHIELLHYRTPASLRLRAEVGARDIASARQIHQTGELDAIVIRARAAGIRFVSPGIVTPGDGGRAATLRDPDGHMIVLTDRA